MHYAFRVFAAWTVYDYKYELAVRHMGFFVIAHIV